MDDAQRLALRQQQSVPVMKRLRELLDGDLAKRVLETLGSKSPIEFVPYAEAYAPGFDDMRRRKPVVEKLERITGFRPKTTLREIIERTAESVGS